jgi:hypothetical protein
MDKEIAFIIILCLVVAGVLLNRIPEILALFV